MENEELKNLVQMMKTGSEDAFIEVYHRFHKSLFFLALKLTKNDADAHDAVQETFIQIRSSIASLQNNDVFILWMRQILVNKCKNIFRKNRDIYMDTNAINELHLCEERREFLPEDNSRFISTSDEVLTLLDQLPLLYRIPLKQRYYEQKSMKEIASELGIPLGTVKSRLRTAKQLMRGEISEYEDKYNTKVDFKSSALGSAILLGSMYPFTKRLPSKLFHSAKGLTFATMLKIATILCVTAFSTSTLYQVYQENMVPNHSFTPSNIDQTPRSDQEAYFMLKQWAHCKNDIMEKSKEEVEQMLPLFTQLEKNKGAFWQLLENENWTSAFKQVQKE